MKNRKLIIGAGVILLVVVVILVAILIFNNKTRCNEALAQKMAQNWIMINSTTYKYDGSDIKLRQNKLLDCDFCYEFMFDFKSSHAGYGDRGGQILAQVLTPHIIIIDVQNCNVVKAINDGRYDEIKGALVKK